MTREELKEAAFELIQKSWELDRRVLPEDILTLFDRYESEQWRPTSEPPPHGNTVQVMGLAFYRAGVGWYTVSYDTWRELPAPPEEEQ